MGGTTDSFGPVLQPVTDGLGFLPYSNSPHHDVEEQRRPLIHRLIAEGTLPDGYATENGTGLVFFGTELHEASRRWRARWPTRFGGKVGRPGRRRCRPGSSEEPPGTLGWTDMCMEYPMGYMGCIGL